MKLLGNTENKITKHTNGESVHHLEITVVVLGHCNIVNNDYQQDSTVLYTFIPNKPFSSLSEIYLKNLIQNFKKLKCGLQTKTVNHQKQKIK